MSAGNRHDVTQLIPLIDARRHAPIAGKVGRPRGKTDRILADRGYDYDSTAASYAPAGSSRNRDRFRLEFL